MSGTLLLSPCASVLLTPAALGQEAVDWLLTYEVFEIAVPHLDLETCPEPHANGEVFCRAAAGRDRIFVFAFRLGGEQCLVATQTIESDRYSQTLE